MPEPATDAAGCRSAPAWTRIGCGSAAAAEAGRAHDAACRAMIEAVTARLMVRRSRLGFCFVALGPEVGAMRARALRGHGSGGRPGHQSPPVWTNSERDHEGTTVGQADVREVQD